MSTAFFALLTGVVWMGLTSQIGWSTFAVGVVLGLVIARLEGATAWRPFGPLRALRLLALSVRLLLTFLWEIVVANLTQLRIVLAWRIDISPGWIEFPTTLESPAMRALLGALISLTPGSVTFEESESDDGSWIVSVHVLDLRDEEALIEHIRVRFEKPMRAMELT